MLFYLGGCGYMGLEVLWRGWSHGSMFLAGGICFLLVGHLGELAQPLPPLGRAVVGAGIITMVELAAGLACNRNYQVWDYRNMPCNLWGQICPQFCLLWILLALAAGGLYRTMDRAMAHYK